MISKFRELVEKSLPFFEVETVTQHAGIKAAASGADLENVITVTNKGYERQHLGLVKKNCVPTMVKDGRLIHLAKSTVDFDGYLVGVGFVAFDCKSCEDAVWRPKKEQLHQVCYLLLGSRLMPRDAARFFYLIEFRRPFDKHGSLRVIAQTYLVQDLERLIDDGKYEPRECDEVRAGTGGVLLDYRAKLLSFSA